MIESGLYNLLANDSSLTPLIAPKGVYFSLMAKEAPLPAIVMHRVAGAPITTFDNASALVQARFQFDSYAGDLLTARKLSKAVRLLLQDYSGILNEGTSMQTIEVNADFDDPFEIGGTGYIFRAVLDISIAYTEPS